MEYRVVTLDQLYKDLAGSPDAKVAGGKVETERRQDPLVGLERPLKFYDEFVFFYCGLLYGFCRLDASVTERFREQSGSQVKSYRHMFQTPLFTIPWFPDFHKTTVARLLQSVPAGPDQANLFDFITSQLVVDRRRKSVWRIKMVPVKIPDPYQVDHREAPAAVDVIVFVPYCWDAGFEIVQPSSMFLRSPEIHKVPLNDTELKTKTEEALK